MKKVFFVYRSPREQILRDVKAGKQPDHSLYGLNFFKGFGIQTDFSDIAYKRINILFWICYPLQFVLIKLTSIGFKLDQAILLLSRLRKADLIITTTDSAGLPILFLKMLKLLNKPVVYISTGLINELKARKSKFVLKFYSQPLSLASTVVCHSKIEKALYEKLIPAIKDKTTFIPFGIDSDFFKCNRKGENFIFSVGRDKSRDFKFLATVARRLKKENFVVVTSESNVIGVDFPLNVSLYFDLPYTKVKDLYCKSKIVFIPLREIDRASGQISFLESLAAQKKVIITRVKGITESYPDLIGKKNVYLYSQDDLGEALSVFKKALRVSFAAKPLNKKYNSRSYARELIKVVNKYA